MSRKDSRPESAEQRVKGSAEQHFVGDRRHWSTAAGEDGGGDGDSYSQINQQKTKNYNEVNCLIT